MGQPRALVIPGFALYAKSRISSRADLFVRTMVPDSSESGFVEILITTLDGHPA